MSNRKKVTTTNVPKNEKTWKCPNQFCNKTFKSQSGLTRHYLNKANGCYKSNEQTKEINETNQQPGIEPDDCMDPRNFFFEDDNQFSFENDDNESIGNLPDSSTLVNNEIQDSIQEQGRLHWIRHYGITFTDTMNAETKLLKILNDANTPHYLFKDMLNWATETNQSGTISGSTSLTRKSAVAKLEKWQNLNHCRPKKVSVAFAEET